MMKGCEWGDPAKARQADRASTDFALKSSSMDRVISVEIGGPFARRFDQYLDILTHNGAPNIFSSAQTIVDAGCGGGFALVGMREGLGKERKLIGIDIRNARLWTARRGSEESHATQDLFTKYNIDFRQGSISQVESLVPEGYDALVAIPAFFSDDWASSFPVEVLAGFYHGLRSGGMAQALISPPRQVLPLLEACLTQLGVPFQFTPGDIKVLKSHGLSDPNGQIGTLTLGPKK